MVTNLEYPNPTWNEIFRVIGKQLHLRKGLLVKRVLIISAPGLVAIFLVAFLSRIFQLSPHNEFFEGLTINTFIYGTIYIIITIIMLIILMSILKIEKVIWLDSYFDGKNLTPKESWKIARRLFAGWLYLEFQMFYRYYIWLVLSVILSFYLWIYFFIISDFAKMIPPIAIGVLSAIWIYMLGAGFVLWHRYFKIRLSYAPFLFMDRYQGGGMIQSLYFWREFFRELKRLHDASKGESFRKNVMLELGADVAMTVVDFTAGQIMVGFEFASRALPSVAGAATSAFGVAASRGAAEVGHHVILFAKMSGTYVLYRHAFEIVHGKIHHVNEYVYNLKN